MNTTEKIIIKENKTLKLTNVLIREVQEKELENPVELNKTIHMIDSYIKSKGNSTIGPMINYSGLDMDENGKAKVILKFMVQVKNPIHKVEPPYKLESQIRITNCIFARFNEEEENLRFAYQKLGVYAFEKDIKLKGDSYTVFVKQAEGEFIADVFMETLKGGEILESV